MPHIERARRGEDVFLCPKSRRLSPHEPRGNSTPLPRFCKSRVGYLRALQAPPVRRGAARPTRMPSLQRMHQWEEAASPPVGEGRSAGEAAVPKGRREGHRGIDWTRGGVCMRSSDYTGRRFCQPLVSAYRHSAYRVILSAFCLTACLRTCTFRVPALRKIRY